MAIQVAIWVRARGRAEWAWKSEKLGQPSAHREHDGRLEALRFGESAAVYPEPGADTRDDCESEAAGARVMNPPGGCSEWSKLLNKLWFGAVCCAARNENAWQDLWP